jgi:dipeptidyl aminopeptidase/acylaminoacyl peptidase
MSYKPNINDLMTIEHPISAHPSPDGSKVAYILSKGDFNHNVHQTNCYIFDKGNGSNYQLTRNSSVSNIEWLNNSSLLLLKSNPFAKDDENKLQIFLFEGCIGEGLKLTNHKTGIDLFKTYGESGIFFVANDPDRVEKKDFKDNFGDVVHVEEEPSASNLYYINIHKMKNYFDEILKVSEDESKKIVEPILDLEPYLKDIKKITVIIPSPAKNSVYINCREKDDMLYFEQTSNYRLTTNFDSALDLFIESSKKKKEEKEEKSRNEKNEKSSKKTYSSFSYLQVKLPKGSSFIDLSPHEDKMLVKYKLRDNAFYTQADLGIISTSTLETNLSEEEIQNNITLITDNFDQDPKDAKWCENGILVFYYEYSNGKISLFEDNGQFRELNLNNYYPLFDFDASKSGDLAFLGGNEKEIFEILLSSRDGDTYTTIRVTDIGSQVKNWDLGTVESIRWKSKDGTEIEGVLRKPSNFDPSKKYPLAFVVHGGPTWLSQNQYLEYDDIFYYPSAIFANNDILVLKPNYRGSIGRGQKFMELNVGNLGTGDLWDLESGIDYLTQQGFIDEEKIGCMGWSQGGYISAFIGTNSSRFKAVSMGAGVSSWATYYLGNDIRQWAKYYLSGNPLDNPTEYEKTAPISSIKNSEIPFLIQHGENDQRVPLQSALEMYRLLKDQGVPVHLFIFKGMPHGITKPRESRGVMNQNLQWFLHHLKDKPLDFTII